MIDIMNFLLENDVVLKSNDTKREMSADEAFVLGGEFIVWDNQDKEIYRGTDFDEAMTFLNGDE